MRLNGVRVSVKVLWVFILGLLMAKNSQHVNSILCLTTGIDFLCFFFFILIGIFFVVERFSMDLREVAKVTTKPFIEFDVFKIDG